MIDMFLMAMFVTVLSVICPILATVLLLVILGISNKIDDYTRKPIKWDGKYWNGHKNIQDMPYDWQRESE